MNHAKVERTVAGRVLSMETGVIARQAGASVLARYGETVVFAAVCTAQPREGIDFFPLSVEYKEKVYSAGKFPGGFIKREGRPTTKEILTSRLIDRPIRPLFPEDYKNEVQVNCMVLSVDKENDPDVVAMNAAFAACMLCDMPFNGPVAAVRVGRVGGKYVAFPRVEETNAGDMDIVVAASRAAVVMVEGGANEISEADFLGALEFGRETVDELCGMIEELRAKANPQRSPWQPPAGEAQELVERVKRNYRNRLREAYQTPGKHDRAAAVDEVRKAALEAMVDVDAPDASKTTKLVKKALGDIEYEVVRRLALEGKRVDGRGPRDVRQITIQSGLLPRTHGSALFTRGETQALVVTTLGTSRDQQIVDGLMEEYAKKFDLQYNFPPFSTGEVKPMRGPGRREIGHGNLAERALIPVIPSDTEFPYALRVVSEIMESNGSSSMASVCGATLSLMDAGCPIRQPVAGIAMGLIKEDDDVAILSDILGTEDHLGDMDFKVAGTGRGITAVQMDIKVTGITVEVMKSALEQAREGRLHILKKMLEAMPRPRQQISEYAPRLLVIKIDPEKIGLVIGPGGKNIKKLQEETGASIEINDDGTVAIACTDASGAEAAKARIELMTAEVTVGKIYEGRVVSIKDFGAFIEVLPGQEGLCHVSEMSDGFIQSPADVVKMGDVVKVKVILRDDQGRLKLSIRAVKEGEGPRPEGAGGPPPRGDRGDRGDRGPRREGGGFREDRGDRGPREGGGFRGDGPRGPRPPRY
ncbi:MAG TPA: polyribonucleotide nucleotidyltransferase [Planctomycetota bacterium]|nr:polyribonucleotide nucleotidyltransferase [Planctomycetota bacterium]